MALGWTGNTHWVLVDKSTRVLAHGAGMPTGELLKRIVEVGHREPKKANA